MKSHKEEMRKKLEAGLAVFLSEGKTITKLNPHGFKAKKVKQPKQQVVEIEVDMLPIALQQKYFAE